MAPNTTPPKVIITMIQTTTLVILLNVLVFFFKMTPHLHVFLLILLKRSMNFNNYARRKG